MLFLPSLVYFVCCLFVVCLILLSNVSINIVYFACIASYIY